jgi:hypothetical protein
MHEKVPKVAQMKPEVKPVVWGRSGFRRDQENQEEVQTMARMAVAKTHLGRRVRKDLEPTAAAETAAQGRDRKLLLRKAL